MFDEPTTEYCPHCGYVGPHGVHSEINWLAFFVATILLLGVGGIIGLALGFFRTKYMICGKCEQRGLLPLDSPVAQRALAKPK